MEKKEKLVREKIPELYEAKGLKFTTRVASQEEYWQKLKEKLKSEAVEFANDESAQELADVLEVVYTIAEEKGWGLDYLEELRKKKNLERGTFKARVMLEQQA